MELLKQVWPQWKVVSELGEGSYGKVYQIERSDVGGTYKAALKVITIPKSPSEVNDVLSEGMDVNSATQYFHGMMEEIVKEFAMMERLKGNTNIVAYEDHEVIEHTDNIGWDILIRMELLTSLSDYMMKRPLTEQDTIKLGIDICKALELCQQYNIIHRDIKPENIFVSELGDYKLGDFGVARTAEKTMSGMSKKGTYTYMAPEVYKGDAYNATVDIYSLGIVLYRLMNDYRTPFLPPVPQMISFSDREKAQARRMDGEALSAPAKASKGLAEIILKACAYSPKERYASAKQMRKALEEVLANAEQATATVKTEEDWDKTVAMTVTGNAENQSPSPSILSKAESQEDKTVFMQEDKTVVMPVEEDKTVLMSAQEVLRATKQHEMPKSEPKPVTPQKSVPTVTPESKKGKKTGLFVGIGALAAVLVIGMVLLLGGSKEENIQKPVGNTGNSVSTGGQSNIVKDNTVQENTLQNDTEKENDIQTDIEFENEQYPFMKENNLLPAMIRVEDEAIHITEAAKAKVHDNSMYPPVSLFGEWVLEDSGSNTGEAMEVQNCMGELLYVNSLPSSFRLGEDANSLHVWSSILQEEDAYIGKTIEEKSIQGVYPGEINFDGAKYEIIYDTSDDKLIVGIVEQWQKTSNFSEFSIAEISYKMEWVGWKLKLTYGDYSATYIPSAIEENESAWYRLSLCSEPLDNIVNMFWKIKKSENVLKSSGTLDVYQPEYCDLMGNVIFEEDGTCQIVTGEKTGNNHTFPEMEYNYQYRLSDYAITLADGEKTSVYVEEGGWYVQYMQKELQKAFDEANVNAEVTIRSEKALEIHIADNNLFERNQGVLSQEGIVYMDNFLEVYKTFLLSDIGSGASLSKIYFACKMETDELAAVSAKAVQSHYDKVWNKDLAEEDKISFSWDALRRSSNEEDKVYFTLYLQ